MDVVEVDDVGTEIVDDSIERLANAGAAEDAAHCFEFVGKPAVERHFGSEESAIGAWRVAFILHRKYCRFASGGLQQAFEPHCVNAVASAIIVEFVDYQYSHIVAIYVAACRCFDP